MRIEIVSCVFFDGECKEEVVERRRPHLVTQFGKGTYESRQSWGVHRHMPTGEHLRGLRASIPTPFEHWWGVVGIGGEQHDVFADHVAEDGLSTASGPHLSGLKHLQAIREALGLVHVMRGEHDAHSLRAQSADQFPNGDTSLGIETGRRFVEKHELGLMDHRACYHESALVAAREHFRLLVRVFLKAELLEKHLDPLHQVRLARSIVATGLDQVGPDSEVAVVGVVLGADTERASGPVPIAFKVVPGDPNGTLIRAEKSVAHPQRRGLARTVGAEQPEHLARATMKVDVVHDALAAQRLDQPTGGEHGIVVIDRMVRFLRLHLARSIKAVPSRLGNDPSPTILRLILPKWYVDPVDKNTARKTIERSMKRRPFFSPVGYACLEMLVAGAVLFQIQTLSAQPTLTGYVTIDFPVGYSLQSMPVQPKDTRVVTMFDEPPNGTEIVIHDGDGWVTNRFEILAWTFPDMRLQMGRGMIVNSPAAWRHTWVGDVWAGDLGNMIPAGESLVSALIPQEGKLGVQQKFPSIEGVEILAVNPESGSFETVAQIENGRWVPADPIIKVGEAFLLRSTETIVWRRGFVPADHPSSGEFIVNDPISGSFAVGDSIQLSVETHDGNYEYQWQRDGVDIPDANESTFSIVALDDSTAGDYLVRVFDESTFDTSAVASVRILSNETFLTIEWDAEMSRPILSRDNGGGPGGIYEVSTDLRNWVPLPSGVAAGDGSIADSGSGDDSIRFYRLRID